MEERNNSNPKKYYTQRNNELNPIRACNVTSIIIALDSAGWSFPKGKYSQAEDNLMNFMLTNPSILAEWEKVDPNETAPPNEWYSLLAKGVNLWLKDLNGPKIELTWMLTLPKYKKVIDEGGATTFAGRFDTEKSKINHMFAGVGYKAQNGDLLTIVVDDPYGDYRDRYKSVIGNDVEMPVSDFIQKGFPYTQYNKLAIIVPKYVKGA